MIVCPLPLAASLRAPLPVQARRLLRPPPRSRRCRLASPIWWKRRSTAIKCCRHSQNKTVRTTEIQDALARSAGRSAFHGSHCAALDLLSFLAGHYLIDRSERIKAAFNSDMDSLISDIQALCAFSQQQKQLCTDYTPSRSRSRAHSTSNGRAAATNSDATVAPAVSAGSMTEPAHVSAAASAAAASASASSNGNGAKQKEFVWRDSHLTTLFRTSSDIQTVYNVFAAVLILFALKVWINDAFNSTRDEGSGGPSISLLLWNFGGVTRVVALWCAFFLTHCLLLPVMWAWRCGRIGDTLYTGLYVLHQCAFLVGFGFAISRADLPVGSSMILLCEQVRMAMKAHSFWRETIRIKYHPSETPQGVLHHSHSHANSTLIAHFPQQLKQFMLFHFVPTVTAIKNNAARERHGWSAQCAW